MSRYLQLRTRTVHGHACGRGLSADVKFVDPHTSDPVAYRLVLLLACHHHQHHHHLHTAGAAGVYKPNTHRRRDETVELRRVGVGGVYMNSQLTHDDCRRIR